MKHRKFWKILLVCLNVVWLGVIYWFSAQNGEDSGKLSGIISQFLLRLFGNFMPEEQFHALLRECAHFGIFAIEGFLLYPALRFLLPNRKHALPIAWGMCVVFAVIDETHQLFSDGRAFELFDIAVDSCGALLGILCFPLILKILRHFIGYNRDISSKKLA